MEPRLEEGDALLVVDPQVDFMPGGALPVPGGDEVVALLNRWLAEAEAVGAPIYVSRDWHPDGHPSFEAEGGRWPRHCVQDSEGARFHPELRIPPGARIVSKGVRFDRDQPSAFDATGLATELRRRDVQRVWIGGLAQEVCVRASALDALDEGFEVGLIVEATRPIDAEQGARALREMELAGVELLGEEPHGDRPPPRGPAQPTAS